MIIIGFDIATVTGYSVLSNDKIIHTGLIKLNPKHERLQRYRVFKEEVSTVIKTYKPKIVAIEDTYVGRNVSTTCYLNLLGGVCIACVPKKCEIYRGSPSSIRKEILGQGRKHEKEDVYKWAVKTYDLDLDIEADGTLDITDSVLLVHWANLIKQGKLKK